MTLLEHIQELRDRLVKSCLALAVATAVAAGWLYDPVLSFMLRAYCAIPPSQRFVAGDGESCRLAALGPTEGLRMRITLSLAVGLVIAMPVVAFQLWRFIAPGLKAREKRFAIPFAMASTLLFAFGVGMAFLTMPKAIGFLADVGGSGIGLFLQADKYLRFVLFMGLAFGAAFEFPLLLVFLSMAGLLSSAGMMRAWRPAVALIIVAAAIITPSQDPISLMAMAVPMWMFYFAAAGVARFVIEPRRARREREQLQGS